jgi:hypothetical protein
MRANFDKRACRLTLLSCSASAAANPLFDCQSFYCLFSLVSIGFSVTIVELIDKL